MNARHVRLTMVLALLIVGLAPQAADAYVGPGAGVSVIGAALALVGGVFLAIVGFVWYPIKRLILRFKRRTQTTTERTTADSTAR